MNNKPVDSNIASNNGSGNPGGIGTNKGLEGSAGRFEGAGGTIYLEGGEHVYEGEPSDKGLEIDAGGEKRPGDAESVYDAAAYGESLGSAQSMEGEGGVEKAQPPEVLQSIEKDKGELSGSRGTPDAGRKREGKEGGIKPSKALDEHVVDVRHGGAPTHNVSSEADGTTKAADAMEAHFIEGVNEAHGDSTNK